MYFNFTKLAKVISYTIDSINVTDIQLCYLCISKHAHLEIISKMNRRYTLMNCAKFDYNILQRLRLSKIKMFWLPWLYNIYKEMQNVYWMTCVNPYAYICMILLGSTQNISFCPPTFEVLSMRNVRWHIHYLLLLAI